MDSVPLVKEKIAAGQRLLDGLQTKGVEIRAACWVKSEEKDRWNLYIATPAVDEMGEAEVYHQVSDTLRSLVRWVWLDSAEVIVLSGNHPIVEDARNILQRFPHSAPIPSPRTLLGGIPADEIYVYQLGKVPVTVYGAVFRDDPLHCLHLSLEPHQFPSSQVLVEPTHEWEVVAPAGATLERNENGQLVLSWELYGNRVPSTANEVWSLAKLGLHGFQFVPEPART